MIMPLSGPWAMVLSHQADLWSKTGARCVVIVCTMGCLHPHIRGGTVSPLRICPETRSQQVRVLDALPESGGCDRGAGLGQI